MSVDVFLRGLLWVRVCIIGSKTLVLCDCTISLENSAFISNLKYMSCSLQYNALKYCSHAALRKMDVSLHIEDRSASVAIQTFLSSSVTVLPAIPKRFSIFDVDLWPFPFRSTAASSKPHLKQAAPKIWIRWQASSPSTLVIERNFYQLVDRQ